MQRLRLVSLWGLAALTLVLVVSCEDEPTNGGVDPLQAQFESLLEDALDLAPGALDAFQRVTTALAGGPLDGVMVTVNGSNVNISVDVDADGNGSRETTVTGNAFFNTPALDLADGATGSLTVPSSSGFTNTVSGSAVMQGTGTLVVDNITGGRTMEGADTEVILTGGDVTVNLLTGEPGGSVGFEVFAGEDIIFGSVIMEPDGAGGWQFRVLGDDFEFTVP